MNIVQRHMLGRILLFAALVCFSLTFAIVLMDPFGLVDFWRLGTMSTPDFLLANLVTVPPILCQTGPLSIAIAVGFVYQSWIRNSEIVALRAIGRSTRSIALPGIVAGVIAMICTGVTSLYVLGATFPVLADIVFVSKVSLSYAGLEEGYLNNIGPNSGLSFLHRRSADVLDDVTLLQWPEPGKLYAFTAKTGTLTKTAQGDVLVLEDGMMQRQIEGQKDKPISFDRMDELIRPAIRADQRGKGFYEQHVTRLLAPPGNQSVSDREYPFGIAEAHHRIITPLVCLNYALLALGALLSGTNSRKGVTFRIVALGVAIAALQISLVIMRGVVSAYPMLLPFLYLYAVIPGSIGMLLITEGGLIKRGGWRQGMTVKLTPARPVGVTGHAPAPAEGSSR